QTNAIIIAATLNTIGYSISLSHCLTGDETGVFALGMMSQSTHPRRGWPQRSQLQPACASVSRTANPSNATCFNISLPVSTSSVNNRVVFIESLLLQLNAIAAAAARLCIYWLLLCKNCPDPTAFERAQYTRALKSYPRSQPSTAAS